MPVSTPKELRKEVAREKIYDTQVYLILFILISAILPLSAPSEPISSSSTTSSAPSCVEALQWPNFCFALKNSSLLSERAQEELTKREARAREMFCDMARLLTKIDCEQPYSVYVNQNQSLRCQEAYRDWACSIVVEFGDEEDYDSGKRMSGSLMPFPSCDSICHRVLRVCPYLTPDRTQLGPTGNAALHPSQYGGHPAFYCPSRTGLIFSNLKSRSEEVQETSGGGSVKPHRWFYKRGSEVNLTDELISSNDTSCCWTYASALKTEQFEDLSLDITFSAHELPLHGSSSLFSLENDEVLIQCLHVYSETVLSVNNNNNNNVNNNNNNNKEEGEEEESDSTYNYNNFLVIDDETINPNNLITKKSKKSYTKQSGIRGASAQTQAVTEESDGGGSEGGIDERNSFLQTVVGDSSEANYYIRDDWFEVSPRSKIQKRNNYNFLTLVSSSTNNNNNNNNNDIINDNNNQQQQQQQQQSPSSSVLSSDEDETDSDVGGVYSGGPISDDITDTENDGYSSSTLDQHHHLHHLLHHEHSNDDEFMTSSSSIGNTVASTSTSNSRLHNFVHEQSNNNKNNYYDKHKNTNRNDKNNYYYNSDEVLSSSSFTAASSSASRSQPIFIKLTAMNLPLLTIQHYYYYYYYHHFPVLLLLLLLLLLMMILLLLMVLLTTNFLPFTLLLNTSFISSTLVVLKNYKYDDNYYDDENEKDIVRESITFELKATAATTVETTTATKNTSLIRPPVTTLANNNYYCNSIVNEKERNHKENRKHQNIIKYNMEKTQCYNYDNNKNNNSGGGSSSSRFYYFRKPLDNHIGFEIMMIKLTYNNNNSKYYCYYYYNDKYIKKRKATITSETVVRYINQHQLQEQQQLILSSRSSIICIKIIRLIGYYNYCNKVLMLLQLRKTSTPFLILHYWIVDDSNRKKFSNFLFILLDGEQLEQGHFKFEKVCILCITKKTEKISHNILPVILMLVRKAKKKKHLLRRIRLLVIQNYYYNDKLLLLLLLHLRNLITLNTKPLDRLVQNCCCNSIKSEKSCSDNNSIHWICHRKKNQLLTKLKFFISIVLILTLVVLLLLSLRLRVMPILLLLLPLLFFYYKHTMMVKTTEETTIIRYWSNLRINKIIKVITIMTIVFTSWGFSLL